MNRFSAGFITGIIAGAVIAFIVTQEETRDAIAGKAREAANAAMDASADLRANAADLYARGKNVIDNAHSNVDDAVAEGQSTAEQIRTDLSQTPQTDS